MCYHITNYDLGDKMSKKAPRCGKRMPISKTLCARKKGHTGHCASYQQIKSHKAAVAKQGLLPANAMLASDGITVYPVTNPEESFEAEVRRVLADFRILRQMLFEPYKEQAQKEKAAMRAGKQSLPEHLPAHLRRAKEKEIHKNYLDALKRLNERWYKVHKVLAEETQEAMEVAREALNDGNMVDQSKAWLSEETLEEAAQRISAADTKNRKHLHAVH